MLCSIGMIMSGPYMGHFRAFLAIITISLLLDAWNGSNFHWSVLHVNQKNTFLCWLIGAICGPYSVHIRSMFWPFLPYLPLKVSELVDFFAEKAYISNKSVLFNVKLLQWYWGHTWPILGPCSGYSCYIFALKILLWFKFSLNSVARTTEKIISNY